MDSGKDVETKTILTCPYCEGSHEIEMPTNYCQIVFVCTVCGKKITPKEGDCCIFCSYADRKCPPEQFEGLRTDRNAES